MRELTGKDKLLKEILDKLVSALDYNNYQKRHEIYNLISRWEKANNG